MFYGCAWLKVPKESTTISVSCERKFASLGQKMSNMVAERRLMEARDDEPKRLRETLEVVDDTAGTGSLRKLSTCFLGGS